MSPSFGTSGLRGLVTDLTDDLVGAYVRAFLAMCSHGGQLLVGRDLRVSSPAIADTVLRAARDAGVDSVDCGAIPTPALAMASMGAGASAIMVTGSHIPANRNGLKFYVPSGEITKQDEARIVAAYAAGRGVQDGAGRITARDDVGRAYVDRYAKAFGATALAGLRVGVYRHSSVARDLLETLLQTLGADTVPLGQSDTFIPVDTEAVAPGMVARIKGWADEHQLDAIVSTDGDGDRPMLALADGTLVPGDTLGVLTAMALGADTVVAPVNSNDMVRRVGFARVDLTRIGSPFVIAGMNAVLADDTAVRVVGFEPNGGFLLGFRAQLAGPLDPLMTRDALLPMLAPLIAARQEGQALGDVLANLPACFTAADRVQDIDRDRATAFMKAMDDPGTLDAFFAETGSISRVDRTDGVRMDFESGVVVHLRPSGNAPEFRIYAQATDLDAARALVAYYRHKVGDRVR